MTGATPDGAGTVPRAASGSPAATGLGRATTIMASGTAVSRVLGVARAILLTVAIGTTGNAANAFAAANQLPNILYLLLAGGVLNAVLVPQLVQAFHREGGQDYVDRLMTLTVVLLAGLTLLVTLGAPLLIGLYTSFPDPQVTRLAVLIALWCIPQVFFYGLYSLLGQVLNARGSFGPYMWAPVVNNVVSMAGLGVFIAVNGSYGPALDGAGSWTAGQVALLAGTATLGVVCQALVLLVPLRRLHIRFRPRWGFRGVGLRAAGTVATWTFAGVAVAQVGVLVMTKVATAVDRPGYAGKAVYDNATTIFMLPHSLITVSLATALFTRLASRATVGDVAGVRADLSLGLRTVGLFTSWAAVTIMVLAFPIARIVFPSADTGSVSALSQVIVAMLVGLVPFGALSVGQRVFYAYQDARSLFPIQTVTTGVIIVGTLVSWAVLDARWWVVGTGAAMTASYLVGMVGILVSLRRRLVRIDGRHVLDVHLRAGVAGVVAGMVGWGLDRLLGDVTGVGSAVLRCVLVGGVISLAYLGLLRVLRVGELDVLLGPVVARLPARLRPVARVLGGGPAPRLACEDRPGGRQSRGEGRVGEQVTRGTVLAGRYRVTAPRAAELPGADDWDAVDLILDRPVRVRVFATDDVAALLDAARRAALVADPRLQRILDVSTHHDLGYIATEPIDGPSLTELVAAGPLPAAQARAIVGEAATALELARRRGVHHLALRPDVLHVGPDGRVVLAGLGVDAALLGQGVGDARSSTRADTVGLVRLLYTALTGRWPQPTDLQLPRTGLPDAPLAGDVAVPPRRLVPGVPADLDTLCSVTLGPHDDGPQSPAELVRELEPWGAVGAPSPQVTQAMPAVEAQAAMGAGPTGAVEAGMLVQPAVVPRLSVRSVLAARQAPGVNLPGTPLPATPNEPVGDVPPHAAAAPWEPVDSPSASPRPAGAEVRRTPVTRAGLSSMFPTPPPTFDAAIGSSEPEPLAERRFDPTRLVLGIVALALVVGLVWAIVTLFRPAGGGSAGGPVPSVSSSASAAAPSGEPSATSAAPAPPAVVPRIASITSVDPAGPPGDHPEAVQKAIDGDPGTFWYSMTYKRPDFSGLKPGLGLVLSLQRPAPVSTVTLHVNGTGGGVEVRAPDAATPGEGTVLASGTLSPDTVLTLAEPTPLSSVVVWFTALPQTADGSNRIELTEVSVS